MEYKILFTDPGKASLVEFDRDTSPIGGNEIGGKTLYSLVSSGTELNVYLGNYDKEGLEWGRLPFTPGYAAVLQTDEVGRNVKDIAKGDLVYCMGRHMSYQRIARDEAILLPAGLDPEKAAFARLMGVTWSSLTLTDTRPPAKVVVAGLGVVGLFGALIFQNSGYDVYGYDPLQNRREAAQAAGLDRVLPDAPLDAPEICGKVSLFLECSANEQALLDGLQLIKRGGEVILVGVPMVRRTEIYAQEVLNRIFRKCAIVRSGSEFQVSLKPADFRTNSILENQGMALQWIAEGKINVDPLYTVESPANPQQIYQAVLNRTMEKLAIVFDWHDYV